MTTPVSFRLSRPERLLSAAVFSSPHSGRAYPPDFLRRSRLGFPALRGSEDAFVDELFAAAPLNGAPLLTAIAPRAYLDLNRAPHELDPQMIEGVGATGLNPRVAAGLGVIPRVVSEGRRIQTGKISREEAEGRIADWHRPYHAQLDALIADAARRFGRAILFDCHSMPADAMKNAPKVRGARADIVLGDRFGIAAARGLMEETAAIFRDAGFVVASNTPFAGGYITQRHGRPARGVSAIQIEIDRRLYMDEARVERAADFDAFRARIEAAIPHLAGVGDRGMLAAE